ncbi:MAG TPA: undecaprenyl-phosphate glucose phosphotransferase [Thalassobaculum sp.]
MSAATWSTRPARDPGRSSVILTASVLSGLMAMADALAVAGGSYVAYLLWLYGDPYATWSPYAIVTALGTLLALNAFALLRLYDIALLRRPGSAIGRLLGACAMVAGILIVLSYFTKTSSEYSRVWAGLWFAIAVLAVCSSRLMVLAMIRRGVLEQALARRVAIVGDPEQAERLLRQIEMTSDTWVRVVRTFAGGPGDLDLEGLERSIRSNEVDTVVVAIPWVEEDWVLQTLGVLYQYPIDVVLSPQGIGLSLVRPRVRYMAEVPMLALADRPLTGWRYVVKEVEDRVLATIILAMILPVLAAVAVAIKLDSKGPVLFRQKRYGFNNQLIEVWKFRTMYHDQTDHNAEQLTRRGDPRITRIGRFLRSSSLDELPQFFNVLRGEMSIVGPRPHAVSAKAGGLLYEEAVRQYAARHRVKPGITGWAQVNGWRGETETVEQIRRRVHHDLAYIEDWSLWLDLKIIVMTIFTGFTGKNAY